MMHWRIGMPLEMNVHKIPHHVHSNPLFLEKRIGLAHNRFFSICSQLDNIGPMEATKRVDKGAGAQSAVRKPLA